MAVPQLVLALPDASVFFFDEQNSQLYHVVPQGLASPDWHTRPELIEALAEQLSPAAAANEHQLAAYWNQARQKVSAVNLNLTDKCNLACVYCYACGGDYDRITREMTGEQAKAGLEQAMAAADPDREFRIEFFGGEPLLNLNAIEEILDWQRSASVWRGHAGGTVNRISTNLTSLDERAIEAIKTSRLIVSISLDGTAAVQDAQRPFKDGSGSFEPIMKNIRRLREASPDTIMVARMTVCRSDQQLLETIQELTADDVFDYVSIYPAALFGQTENDTGKSHFSQAFREQYLQLAAAYPELLPNRRFRGCLELNRYCEAILQGKTVLNHCRAGAGYFTLSPDGSVHPCHRLVGDAAWNLGAFNTWIPEPMQERLQPWQTPVSAREGCRSCRVRFLCGGGCKQQQLIATGDLLGRDPHVCAFSQLLFEAALTVIAAVENPQTSGVEQVKARLRRSFNELTRLFTLCGQPLADNGRQPAAGKITLTAGGQTFACRALHWGENV